MKNSIYKILIFLFLFIHIIPLKAQETYSKRIDIDGQLEYTSEALFYKNNIITYGQGAKLNGSLSTDIDRFFLVSTDKQGNVKHHKSFDSIIVLSHNKVLCVVDDTIYALVRTLNKNRPDTLSIAFLKMTSSFDSISSTIIPCFPMKKKNGYFYDPREMATSSDGNLYCLLRGPKLEVIKISRSGKVLTRKFIASEQDSEGYVSMLVSSTGDVYFTVMPYLKPKDKDKKQPILMKYDGNLNLQWIRTYPEVADYENSTRIKERHDGTIVFSTILNITFFGAGIDTIPMRGCTIYNVDTSGKVLWRLPIYATETNGGFYDLGLDVLHNDDIIVSGEKQRVEKLPKKLQNGEGWLLCISKQGKCKWERRIRDERGVSIYSRGIGEFVSTLEDEQHSLYACGTFAADTFPNYKPYVNNYNIWIVRLDSMGCLTPNCDTTQEIVGLREFIVLGEKPTQIKVFPNPVSDILNIDFQGNEDWLAEGKIAYEILNSIGQIMLQGILSESSLRLNDIPKGNYILHFMSNKRHGFAKIQKE